MELIGKSLSNFLIYDRTTPPTKLVYLKLTNIQAQLKMSSFMFAISSLAQTALAKGSFQKLLSGFFPLRGGGFTPHSAKLFWAQELSVKGGGEYPPIPLRKNSAKKQLFLAKKRLF